MTIFEEIEKEVQQAANSMTLEVLFLLFDKWDREYARKAYYNELTLNDKLGYYVRMKVSLHHVKRRYERYSDWKPSDLEVDKYEATINNLNNKTKEARKEYYVAKRRVEGEHVAGCSCRGCRCIKEFQWDSTNEARSYAN